MRIWLLFLLSLLASTQVWAQEETKQVAQEHYEKHLESQKED